MKSPGMFAKVIGRDIPGDFLSINYLKKFVWNDSSFCRLAGTDFKAKGIFSKAY